MSDQHEHWKFECPKCAGWYFGSSQLNGQTSYYCNDQYKRGCDWEGQVDQCDRTKMSVFEDCPHCDQRMPRFQDNKKVVIKYHSAIPGKTETLAKELAERIKGYDNVVIEVEPSDELQRLRGQEKRFKEYQTKVNNAVDRLDEISDMIEGA